ncbi:MAG: P-loop NTPase fold protein [Acidimicrobiia bacterium]
MANETTHRGTAARFVILSDSPALDGPDPLEFGPIADRLQRIILASQSSAPFTVSIEAGWGAGKSSLMRRVQRGLEHVSQQKQSTGVEVRTVWFNAWTAPQAQVLEGLVRSVLDKLDTNLLRRLARKRKLLKGVGLGVSVLAGLFRLGNIADRIWEKVSVDPKQRNELNDFVRQAMDEWLKQSSAPQGKLIVVFVDDLDRCSSSTVLQVFEAIKLYLDAPGFVFVLGWDTEQVLRAVAAEHGDADRLPQRYIEKIVQFGFRIPRPSEAQLRLLVDTLCESAGLTEDVLAAEHRQLLITSTEGNPRRLKRFINRFILLYEMIGGTTDAAALIQLMVLQVSYDGFYQLLANVPGEADQENPLFEVVDYVTARQALGRGQEARVSEILSQRGYPDAYTFVREKYEAFEATLPAIYPELAIDRVFTDLVLAMPDDTKRELRRLARSDELQVAESTASDSSRMDAPDDFDRNSAVVPGTTVLWIDDKPKPADHALLPKGVRLITATSTDEAKRLLAARQAPVDLLISDIGRGADRDAGIEGLRAIRSDGLYDGPAVFFTLRPTGGQVAEAHKLRAEVTSSPRDLQRLLQQVLPTVHVSAAGAPAFPDARS